MSHATPNAAPSAHGFDELDPHGAHHHSSHHIVGPFTLRVVLSVLLFFTLLTVGLAQAEEAIAAWLNIELPGWVNVAVAMSIACVKAALVMAFFMQLKYDSPVNTLVMAFCLFAVSLFLFFTGLDLFTRDRIYEFKSPQVVAGGTGTGDGKPLVQAARDKYLAKVIEEVGPDKAQAEFDKRMSVVHHGHAHHEDDAISANRTRPVTGLTGALSEEAKASAHGEHAPAEAHTPAAEPAPKH